MVYESHSSFAFLDGDAKKVSGESMKVYCELPGPTNTIEWNIDSEGVSEVGESVIEGKLMMSRWDLSAICLVDLRKSVADSLIRNVQKLRGGLRICCSL